jgi:hypothetical protein
MGDELASALKIDAVLIDPFYLLRKLTRQRLGFLITHGYCRSYGIGNEKCSCPKYEVDKASLAGLKTQ